MKKTLLFLFLISFFACQNASPEQTPPQIEQALISESTEKEKITFQGEEIKDTSYRNEKLSKLNFDSGKVFKDSLPNTIDPFLVEEGEFYKYFKIDSIFKNKNSITKVFEMVNEINQISKGSTDYKLTTVMNEDFVSLRNPDFLNDAGDGYNQLETLSLYFLVGRRGHFMPIKKIEHLLKPKFVAELHRRYKF